MHRAIPLSLCPIQCASLGSGHPAASSIALHLATLAACPGFSITDINPDIMVPWNSARTKVQLKLSVQRTKMLQEKKVRNCRSLAC